MEEGGFFGVGWGSRHVSDSFAKNRLLIAVSRWEFVRRKASTDPGISYTVETGTGPADLHALDLNGATVVSIDATWERVTVVDPVISAVRMGRLKITGL